MRSKPKLRQPLAHWGNNRGQASAEAILILPLVCLFLFGVIDFGFAWNIKSDVAAAARLGAMQGTVAADPCGKAREVATDFMKTQHPDLKVTVSANGVNDSLNPGDKLKVTVVCQIKPIAPLISFSPRSVQSTSIMVIADVR